MNYETFLKRCKQNLRNTESVFVFEKLSGILQEFLVKLVQNDKFERKFEVFFRSPQKFQTAAVEERAAARIEVIKVRN